MRLRLSGARRQGRPVMRRRQWRGSGTPKRRELPLVQDRKSVRKLEILDRGQAGEKLSSTVPPASCGS